MRIRSLYSQFFSDDDALESEVTVEILSSSDEVTQPAPMSKTVFHITFQKSCLYLIMKRKYLYLKMKKYQQHIWKNNLLLVLIML